jgi:MFS family permease
MPALVRRDRNFRSFLVARALGSIGAMANVFYTVYALRTWEAPDWWVATFTTVLLAGQMVANLAFGLVADRAGHRLVLISGAVAGVAGNLLALGAPSIGLFAAVFALSGIQIASISVSSMNVLLEFAPTPDERPTYVGLGSTLLAPVVFAAPLAAGMLADVAGFSWVFAAAALGGVLSAGVLIARMRDPRQHPGAKRDAEP